MNMHAFKDFHFLFKLQDDRGDFVGYTAIELFNHLMDQYVQLEDVADQIKELHKILEQNYDPNKEPQVYYNKILQDARNTLKIYVYTQQNVSFESVAEENTFWVGCTSILIVY